MRRRLGVLLLPVLAVLVAAAAIRWWDGSPGAVRDAVLLLAVAAVLLAGVPWVTAWVLRPVRELDRTAHRVRSGDLAVRVDAEHGPPELRELAAGFNAMVEQVERAELRRRTFVQDAAHQLGNPLAVLRLILDDLAPGPGDDLRAEAIEVVDRMAATLSSLRDGTGLAPVSGDRECPADVLRAGRPTWQALLDPAGLSLEITDGGVTGPVHSPAGGLGAALDELLSNAARLSGGTRVRVAAVPAGPDEVRVVVTDDGAGLSAEERVSALYRSWRADRHRDTGGTGLGLAILAEAVAAAGGSLTLEPARSHGLRVVLTLRRADRD